MAVAAFVLAAMAALPTAEAGAMPSSCGRASAKLYRVRVQVQKGLKTTVPAFASDVMNVLCYEKSWVASGKVRYRYDPKGPYVVKLLSPGATEERCQQLTGLSVHHYYSCASRAHKEAVLNSDRWFGGSAYWPGTVAAYRRLLVNHEFGHVLGQHHRSCPGSRKLAPVMQQQSKGLNGCKANRWPLGYELRSLSP
jgi:hypothetical protein